MVTLKLIPTLWPFGKLSLVISPTKPKLLSILWFVQVKRNGMLNMVLLCFYHMVTMVMDQSTLLVELKDTYNYAMTMKEYQQMMITIVWECKELTCKLLIPPPQLNSSMLLEDNWEDHSESHWLLLHLKNYWRTRKLTLILRTSVKDSDSEELSKTTIKILQLQKR